MNKMDVNTKITAREIIIDLIQQTLTGQLKPESQINPAHIADAISAKVDFVRSSSENKNINLVEKINELKTDMEKSFESLEDDETLLKNFISGKITAYEEILNTLK